MKPIDSAFVFRPKSAADTFMKPIEQPFLEREIRFKRIHRRSSRKLLIKEGRVPKIEVGSLFQVDDENDRDDDRCPKKPDQNKSQDRPDFSHKEPSGSLRCLFSGGRGNR
jgi:hypothetical protein